MSESSDSYDSKKEAIAEMLPRGFKEDSDYVDYMSYRVRYMPYLVLGSLVLLAAGFGISALF